MEKNASKGTSLKESTRLRSQKREVVMLLLFLMNKKKDMTQLEFLWPLVTKLKVSEFLILVVFTIYAQIDICLLVVSHMMVVRLLLLAL